MLILGIETSTDVSSVSIWSRSGPQASMSFARGRGHVEFLMPAIKDIEARAGITTDKLTGVAVGLGPGLFTSMRVGIATAKTIAQTLQIPIIGISSLDLLAYGVKHSAKTICACIDAKRKEVYAAFYRHSPGGLSRLTELETWNPEALGAEILRRDEPVLLVGNGMQVYEKELAVRHVELADADAHHPRADVLCELAIPRFEREETIPVAQLEPLYVRRSDAEINWERRGVVIERPNRVQISKKARPA
jgi:tRNA threonylcarbamoyladenosine biosynthesis protein TsaB